MATSETVLQPYSVKAHNYATAHANRIHEDTVAASFGFKGGLVTGIALYAYLVHPIVAEWGSAFFDSSDVRVRFLQPVYDQEQLTAAPRKPGSDTIEVNLEGPDGAVRAVASYTKSLGPEPPDIIEFPFEPLTERSNLTEARIANLKPGTTLGSLEWTNDPSELEAGFLRDMREDLSIFRGPEGIIHPAYLLAQANEILMRNTILGPWIHTGSDIRHFGLPTRKSRLSLRGKIADSFERKGHELVSLDLALIEDQKRVLASIKHTAIIHLRAS